MTESYEEAVHSANCSHSNDRLTPQRMLVTVAVVIAKALDTNDYHSGCREKQTKRKPFVTEAVPTNSNFASAMRIRNILINFDELITARRSRF